EHLESHVGWYGVYHVASTSDDRVDANVVLVLEGFANGVDAGQCDSRRGKCVHPLIGRAAGVARPAEKADKLGHHAVVGAADGHIAVFGSRRGVDHHGDIDVVDSALAEDLGLDDEEIDLSLLAEST